MILATRAATALALSTIAASSLMSLGCDPQGHEDVDAHDFEIEFRLEAVGDLTDGPRRLNTNFLGLDDEIPFDHLPMYPGAVSGVDLLEIWSDSCGPGNQRYSTAAVPGLPSIPVNDKGHLGSIVLYEVGDPGNTCTISGPLWNNTHWEIRVTDAVGVHETDLRLSQPTKDMFGYTAYRWDFNVPRFDPSYPGEIQYAPTCDQNLDGNALFDMSFLSYLIPNFDVDPTTGDRLLYRGALFIGCASGVIGKTNLFGYRHHHEDTFETATRMVGADYCGDGNRMTEEGTPVVLSDNLGVWSDEPPVAGYVREAVWNVAVGSAICIDNPRRPEIAGPSIVCNGVALPACDASHLAIADLTTSIED